LGVLATLAFSLSSGCIQYEATQSNGGDESAEEPTETASDQKDDFLEKLGGMAADAKEENANLIREQAELERSLAQHLRGSEWERLVNEYDKNGDGQLEPDEWARMPKNPAAADTNGDERITVEEYAAWSLNGQPAAVE